MAPTKKTSNSSTSSSSALAAASNQGNTNAERITTRGMKAKAALEAASSGSQDNNNTTPQNATSSAANTSPSTDNSAEKSSSKSGEQTSKTTKGKQASSDANTTTGKVKAKATSANKKAITSSAPVKGKGKAKASETGTGKPQQSQPSKKGKGKVSKKQPINKVADTSHLIMKKKSRNGKVLVNSNGRPINFQAAIDISIDKWVGAELKNATPSGTQLPAVSAPNMRDGFKAMGFASDQVTDMMGRRETIKVDGYAQRPMGDSGKHVKDTGPAPVKKTRSPRGEAAPKYAEFLIWKGKPWILFDPLKGYPDGSGLVPDGITKWETYQPGNARLLLQHRNSKSIISRAPPTALAGQTVDYTPSGPRVAGWEPIGREKMAPEPEPEEPAAATTAPPLLGRGARRATRLPASSEATTSSPAAGKRKAEAISADAAPPSSPPPEAGTTLPPPPPSPLETAAPTPAGENLAGEGKQKRKRRPGRPKKSAARVENSSSE